MGFYQVMLIQQENNCGIGFFPLSSKKRLLLQEIPAFLAAQVNCAVLEHLCSGWSTELQEQDNKSWCLTGRHSCWAGPQASRKAGEKPVEREGHGERLHLAGAISLARGKEALGNPKGLSSFQGS